VGGRQRRGRKGVKRGQSSNARDRDAPVGVALISGGAAAGWVGEDGATEGAVGGEAANGAGVAAAERAAATGPRRGAVESRTATGARGAGAVTVRTLAAGSTPAVPGPAKGRVAIVRRQRRGARRTVRSRGDGATGLWAGTRMLTGEPLRVGEVLISSSSVDRVCGRVFGFCVGTSDETRHLSDINLVLSLYRFVLIDFFLQL
jgi:hypothetical protein